MAKAKSLNVKFNGSKQECTGEHSVFIGGQCITFMDGSATVTQGQYDLLLKNGYIGDKAEEVPDTPPVNPPDGDPNKTGEGKEGGGE